MSRKKETSNKIDMASAMLDSLRSGKTISPTFIPFIGYGQWNPAAWIIASETVLEGIEKATETPLFERPEGLKTLLSAVSEHKETLEKEKLLCDKDGYPIKNVQKYLQKRNIDTNFLESVA